MRVGGGEEGSIPPPVGGNLTVPPAPQRLPVPEPLPEPPGRLRGRPRPAPPPCPHVRRRQRPLHHRHGGGVRRHRQVRPVGLGEGPASQRGAGGVTGCVSSPLHGRKKLLEYLYSLKQPDGSFLMHIGGEVDVRWASAAVLGAREGHPGPGAVAGSGCRGGPEHPPPAEAPTAPPRWPR